MNKKTIKCMIASLIAINCVIVASSTIASASTSSLALYTQKDAKAKSFNVFSEENYKYLSSDQKTTLLELKKYRDSGNDLSEDQQKTLYTIADTIIKGKLGDKNYQDFKSLVDKKRSNQDLSEEENKRLKDYNDIIDGSKLTGKEILNQFLR